MDFLSGLKTAIVHAWNRALQRLMIPTGTEADEHLSTAGRQQLEATLDAIPDLMFELDDRGHHLDFRALRPELLVTAPENFLGKSYRDVLPVEAAEAVEAALQEARQTGYSQGTQIYLPTQVGYRWFEISIARKGKLADEGPRFIVLSRDITERKQALQITERMAYFDALTKLPNRHLLLERLEQAIAECGESGHHCALLFIDLDKFKDLNDSEGHYAGDLMLKMVGDRLQASVRPADLVARWGGDEFVILMQGLDRDSSRAGEQAATICEQLVKRLNAPYRLNGRDHVCTGSIGVCLFKGEDGSADSIINAADTAMYNAKRSADMQYAFSAPPEAANDAKGPATFPESGNGA